MSPLKVRCVPPCAHAAQTPPGHAPLCTGCCERDVISHIALDVPTYTATGLVRGGGGGGTPWFWTPTTPQLTLVGGGGGWEGLWGGVLVWFGLDSTWPVVWDVP